MDDILFLPSSYFCPMTPIRSDDECYSLTLYSLTQNTYAIHKCDNTWKNEIELKSFQKTKEEYRKINKRLLNCCK